MIKTWTFSSDEDIIQVLGNIISKIREGTIYFECMEVSYVMSELKDMIIEDAEASDDNH